MKQSEGSFFDPKTMLAIVLVVGVWIGWQGYLTKKYPDYSKSRVEKSTAETEVVQPKNPTQGEPAKATEPAVKSAGLEITPVLGGANESITEKTIAFENEVASFEISSRGMGFKKVTLKKFKNRDHALVTLGDSEQLGLFELRYLGQPVNFQLEELAAGPDGMKNIFVGLAQVGQMKIKRTLEFTKSYSIRSETSVENPPMDFKGFQIVIGERASDVKPGSVFSPATDVQEFVFGTGKNFERLNTTSKVGLEKVAGLFDVTAVASHYFVTGFANESEIVPEVSVKAKVGAKTVEISSWFRPANLAQSMIFPAVLFAGPKDLDLLQAASGARVDLTPIVNFGFFGAIGKILLKILQVFHDYVLGNWGVAIILLTLLVRMLVLPFNLASYKSMKKMAAIQPRIQALRERYKDDSTTLNTEMMKLMKDNKVNPIGGCLPMLLQMPVFFALYQVLGQSIELYQAPFFGWITDLSLKDPFFILPILMGISMWYNQKITPSTMDPAQAKVMQFLPLVFSVMMIALPSGLTLYIFVSTLFGIIQQQIFMKDRKNTAAAV